MHDDGRDTILGHLRKNWSVFAGFAVVLVGVGAAWMDLRDQVRETQHSLDRLQDRFENHMAWHRTNVGSDPEPPREMAEDEEPRSNEDESAEDPTDQVSRPPSWGLLRRGEQEPYAYVTGERVMDLSRRNRTRQLSDEEIEELAALVRWTNLEMRTVLNDARLRLLEMCEQHHFPHSFCRDAYRHGPFPDDAFDLCVRDFPRARCLGHARQASQELLRIVGARGTTFFQNDENGCASPRPELRAMCTQCGASNGADLVDERP